ncbi:MAG: hypothetical protein ACRD1M_11185 [Terriglobales bacterium]
MSYRPISLRRSDMRRFTPPGRGFAAVAAPHGSWQRVLTCQLSHGCRVHASGAARRRGGWHS